MAAHSAVAPSGFLQRVLLCLLLSGSSAAAVAGVDGISAARYVEPVTRYGHFAPGKPHEYARIEARLASGATRVLALPNDEVFEDVRPRQLRLTANGPVHLLTVISHQQRGAALALVGVVDNQLTIVARSSAIGTAMRWLNPVATADLDGDGIAEIAAVITPHISGSLKIFQRSGNTLLEVATLDGFSNHVYGSAELGLSTVVTVAGRKRLLVPDQSRRTLRLIEFAGGRLREVGRCGLDAPITGAMVDLGDGEIEIMQSGRVQKLKLANCTY